MNLMTGGIIGAMGITSASAISVWLTSVTHAQITNLLRNYGNQLIAEGVLSHAQFDAIINGIASPSIFDAVAAGLAGYAAGISAGCSITCAVPVPRACCCP